MWRKRISPSPDENQELLGLHVVIVVAAGDAGPGARNEDLPEPGRLDELGQAAAVVALHVQPVLGPRRLDVGKIGRVELLVEADGEIGRAERLLHLAERLDAARQVAQRQRVRRDRVRLDESAVGDAAAGPFRPVSAATTSSTWTSSISPAGSEIWIGRSWATLWQNVATTEL